MKVSDTVREVVTRHLARLEEDQRRALAAAAQHQVVADNLQAKIADLVEFLEEAKA